MRVIFCCLLSTAFLQAQTELSDSPAPSFTSLTNANCIDAADNFIHVTYTEGSSNEEKIFYTRSSDYGNTWENAIQVSGNGHGAYPSIAASNQYVHIVFFSAENGALFYIRSQDHGATWENPVFLSPLVELRSYPSIAVNGSFLHVTWEYDWPGEQKILYKRSPDQGQTWSDDVMVSETGTTPRHPSVAASSSHVQLVYLDDNGIQYVRSLDNGEHWSDPLTLSIVGEQPSLTVSDNIVMVVWVINGFQQIYSVRSTDHGETWENETMPVENYNDIAEVKIVSRGNFFYLTWSETGQFIHYSIHTAISTDGGNVFTNYGPSPIANESAGGAHAVIHERDVHLICHVYRQNANQEIVYLKHKGLNSMALANEFEWGFGMGSLGGDSGEAIGLDSAGNVYIAGYFSRTVDFDPSANVANQTSNGGYDVFISKYNSTGQLVWSRSIGGSQHDDATDLFVDHWGNVYVTGCFRGEVDFDPGPGVSTIQAVGSRDIFIMKLDSDGYFIWARGMGGLSDDVPGQIVGDPLDRIICVGSFSGSADFDPGPNELTLTSQGDSDAFVSVLDTNGMLIHATSVGGPGADHAYGLSLTPSNSIVVTGFFSDSVDFDPGPGEQWHVSKGKKDVYVWRLATDLQWEWSGTIGAAGHDAGNAIEVDPEGNILVVGEYRDDVDMDPGPGEYFLSGSSGSRFNFALKLDSLGQFKWARGFPISDLGFTRMKLDSFGCLYLIGSFQIINLSPPSWDIVVESDGQDDVLLMKIDTSGDWMWINPLRGSGYAIGRDLALEGLTSIYVTGHFTEDLDLDPSTEEALLAVPSTNYTDIFITQNRQCIPKRAAQAISACGRYKAPDGETLFHSGTYRIVIPAVDGCDSVITLQLTILRGSPVTKVTLSACDQYTTPSGLETWTQSGTYYELLSNVAGCDSLVLYYLTITEHPDTVVLHVSGCHSYSTSDSLYTWTTTGMYEAVYSTAGGCDSVVQYHLTIFSDQDVQYAVTSCDSYTTPDGMYTWNTSDTYHYTLLSVAGCDSFITVVLDIIDIDTHLIITDTALIVQQTGGTYQWINCENGELLPHETNPVLMPPYNGVFAAIISLQDCQDTTACLSFTTVDTDPLSPSAGFYFYPNPAVDVIRFVHPQPCDEMTVTLLDPTGRVLLNQRLTDSHIMLLPENIISGMYFVRLLVDGRVRVISIVVE